MNNLVQIELSHNRGLLAFFLVLLVKLILIGYGDGVYIDIGP
jgi:hypothetical protein